MALGCAHQCCLALAGLFPRQEERGLAAHRLCHTACMPLDQVLSLISPEGFQDTGNDKGLACQTIWMTPRQLLQEAPHNVSDTTFQKRFLMALLYCAIRLSHDR